MSGPGAFSVFDLARRKLLRVLPAPEQSWGVNAVLTKDNRFMIAGHRRHITIWRRRDWKPIAKVDGFGPIALSADGGYLAYRTEAKELTVTALRTLMVKPKGRRTPR